MDIKNNDENYYRIGESILNNILGYLGERPYKEVSHIIAELYSNVELIENCNKETEKEEE